MALYKYKHLLLLSLVYTIQNSNKKQYHRSPAYSSSKIHAAFTTVTTATHNTTIKQYEVPLQSVAEHWAGRKPADRQSSQSQWDRSLPPWSDQFDSWSHRTRTGSHGARPYDPSNHQQPQYRLNNRSKKYSPTSNNNK